MTKRLACFAIFQLFSFAIFSLELIKHDELTFIPRPIITLPEEVNGLAWSENDYFALAEKKHVVFSISDEIGDQMIASPGGNVKYIEFVKNPETGDDILLVVTENNVVGMKVFSNSDNNYLMTKVYDPDLEISSIDFSPEGNRILLGLESGEVRLMMPMYITQDIAEFTLDDHMGGVYAVSFSDDGRYFLSASRDGFINIYSREKETERLFTIKSDTKQELPVRFTPDSRFVVTVKQKRNIIFRDFGGNVIQEIYIDRNVVDYSMSTDSNFLFVLAENSLIYIYNINSGEKVGYIPPFNKYPIVRFAFNKDESRLLVGHSDGSVYYLKSEEVILEPDALPPRQGSDSLWHNITGFDRNANSIELRGNFNLVSNSYFSGGGSLTVGYTNAYWTAPFYFGLFFTPLIVFPRDDFPYKYYNNNGELIRAPCLLELQISIPIGVAVLPFNKDFEFFGELQPGLSMRTLYTPGYYFGNIYYTATLGFYVGAAYKRIMVYIGGVYDFGFGFMFSAGAGYRIKLGKF